MKVSSKSPKSRNLWRQVIRFLASLKLAVVIMIALGIVTAWGTIVEAQLDALAAKKIVYNSIWMWSVLTALVICLAAVMVDRWPWQKRHTSFVLAHSGIIILLFGAWLTQRFGVDGSISMGIGDKQKSVVVEQTDLAVYSSFDGAKFTKLFDHEVDFFLSPAQKKPVSIGIPGGEIKVVESLPYAFREQNIVQSTDENSGGALRLQLLNKNVNMTEWVLQPSKDRAETKDLGPAQIMIVPKFPRDFGGRNAILFRPINDEKIEYNVHSVKSKVVKKGVIRAGEMFQTDWMNLEVRLLKFIPHAKEEVSYKKFDVPTPVTTSAIRIEYQIPGKPEKTIQWMGLNSLLKLYGENEVYVVSYANRRLPLGFEMTLKDFQVGRYQGTMRAATYESRVVLSDGTEHLISMNEPLKHAGFTFYQSSFESDPSGRPSASILSVNKDPGRGLKYLGSLLVVLGSSLLFFMKRRAWIDLGLKRARGL